MTTFSASLQRIFAIFMKEVVQMRRDRLTFGMMFGIPILQLILFGYAINLDPKHLPTALLIEDNSPIIRTLIASLETSAYYDFIIQTDDPEESQALLATGDVSFVIIFPVNFTRDLLRGERPQILIEADATDPAAASNALAQAQTIFEHALRDELTGPLAPLMRAPPAFELITHANYNPEGKTSYNIVPGLLGVILTMTLVMITGMAMTREVERGTMENLLAMPTKPREVMLGKILPYVAVGASQTVVILVAADRLFGVPFIGNIWLLLAGVTIFVIANLSLGFTFSTIAKSQMQAMQLTFFFFLPSLLLSGFMFPFQGMPKWAQFIGEAFPLTNFLRVVRGVMLKDAAFDQLREPFIAMGLFTVIVMGIALTRYRRTLD